MKTNLLLPNNFKRIGWILLIPSTILGLLALFQIVMFDFLDVKVFAIYDQRFMDSNIFFGVTKNNITDEIFGILIIIGAILVGFSKEKNEDEFIAKTRLESLVWATYVNYIALIFCFIFFYDGGFLYVMIFNMFTILTFFIIRFYYVLYKSRSLLSYEK